MSMGSVWMASVITRRGGVRQRLDAKDETRQSGVATLVEAAALIVGLLIGTNPHRSRRGMF